MMTVKVDLFFGSLSIPLVVIRAQLGMITKGMPLTCSKSLCLLTH